METNRDIPDLEGLDAAVAAPAPPTRLRRPPPSPRGAAAALGPADLHGQRLAALRFGDGDQGAMWRILKAAGPDARVYFFDEMIDVFEEALAGRALGLTTRQHVEAIPIGSLAAIPYSGLPLEHFLCYRASRPLTRADDAFVGFMRSHARFYW